MLFSFFYFSLHQKCNLSPIFPMYLSLILISVYHCIFSALIKSFSPLNSFPKEPSVTENLSLAKSSMSSSLSCTFLPSFALADCWLSSQFRKVLLPTGLVSRIPKQGLGILLVPHWHFYMVWLFLFKGSTFLKSQATDQRLIIFPIMGFPDRSVVKNLPADAGDVGSIYLEKEMATQCRILDWRIPWTEDSEGLQSVESQRVSHNLEN